MIKLNILIHIPLFYLGWGSLALFYKNVLILSACVCFYNKKAKCKKFCSHFKIHAAHHVFVKNKSLVQAKIFFFSKYVDMGT